MNKIVIDIEHSRFELILEDHRVTLNCDNGGVPRKTSSRSYSFLDRIEARKTYDIIHDTLRDVKELTNE